MSLHVDILVPDNTFVLTALSQSDMILEWAKKFCKSYITNIVVRKDDVYYYRFFFGDSHDQLLFKLKWL